MPNLLQPTILKIWARSIVQPNSINTLSRFHIQLPLHSETNRSADLTDQTAQPSSWAMQPKSSLNSAEVIVLADSDSDRINPTLEPQTKPLSRFAHKDVAVAARSTKMLPDTLGKQATTKRVPRTFEFGVPDSTISKLKSCVCCDVKWTTRKTATQKMNHIKTCARKHAYTPETVTILLKKELGRTDEPPPPDTLSENIHLGDLVQQKQPKKRKRSNVQSLVEAYSDAKRSTILRRAQAILRSPSPDPRSTISSRSSTSQFLENEIFQEFPSSPQFRPSGLTCRYATSFTTIDALPPTMEHRSNNTPRFRPDAGTVAKLLYTYLVVHEAMQQIKAPSDDELSSVQLYFPVGGLSLGNKTKRKSSTKMRPVKAGRKPLEEWKMEFRCNIMNNQDLCNQILRYEPIHFDTLLDLAPAGYSSTRLRSEISTFLNEQGITSFGSHKRKTQRQRRIRKRKY